MPLARRPSPLSDEVCASSPAPVLLGAPNNVLGATNNGVPLPVKNTFVDMPTGLTPGSLKNWREPMMTAPAGLSKKMTLQATPVPESSPQPYLPGETPPATPQSIAGFHYAVTTPTSVLSYSGMLAGGAAFSSTPYAATPFTPAPTTQAEGVASAVAGLASLAQDQFPFRNGAPPADQPLAKVSWEQVTDDFDGEAEAGQDEDSDDESDEGGENAPQQLRNPEDAPKPPPGALHPSIGSEGHAAGCCKRCCFFPRGRCANGYECEFCHYEHDKRKRKNKKKRTIRGRQSFGCGTTRLLLAKELLRSSATRSDGSGNRRVITVPAAAMERRPGLPTGSSMPQAQTQLLLQAAAATGSQAVPAASLAAWLAAVPGQHQFLGYCQASDAAVPRPQMTAAGNQQLLVYGGAVASGAQPMTATQLPAVGNSWPTDSVQVVVHNPQQPASHMIMLPPAMSQASVQGGQQLQHQQNSQQQNSQRYCDPPPPPMQSPRLQRILGLPHAGPGAACVQR